MMPKQHISFAPTLAGLPNQGNVGNKWIGYIYSIMNGLQRFYVRSPLFSTYGTMT